MNDFKITTDFILMLLPIIAIQLMLFIYCAVKIFKEGVQSLNKWGWLIICFCISILGPMVFLMIGRRRDYQ